MMRFIAESYKEELPIEGIAQAAHVSKRVCFRLFQENLHMTPVEYIRSVRLKEAAHKLVDTQDPITQIGYACGLGAPSYFGKLFREQYGCTPGEYRKNGTIVIVIDGFRIAFSGKSRYHIRGGWGKAHFPPLRFF